MGMTYIYPPVSVQTSSAPIEFVQDGSSEQVNYDTANAANTKPLPSGMFFLKDGEFVPVLKDTAVPANNVPVPVEDLNLFNELATFANENMTNLLAIISLLTKESVSNLFVDYATTPVDDTAWVELIPATPDVINHMTLFESGGFPMEIGIGAIGLETRLFVVPPGGFNGEVNFTIPTGSRVSIRCLVTQTVNVGNIVANFLK